MKRSILLAGDWFNLPHFVNGKNNSRMTKSGMNNTRNYPPDLTEWSVNNTRHFLPVLTKVDTKSNQTVKQTSPKGQQSRASENDKQNVKKC